ncbi:hypothetical protein ACO0RG_001651 [Hanseniaspora osmophila]|uniref:ER membrane protein complex subunit 1 n=1 Tax=Hanseniaspora osmophila TaxID=56408 RepID=A0A1E5RI08_9ASCO|nr:ER membrane protein complex subunit 1 [Hanseniaspora osmophila]
MLSAVIGAGLIANAFVRSVGAVFEDEVYKVDWEIQNLGTYSCIAKSGKNPNELVVLSQIADGVNLLGTLDVRDGTLTSRKLLETEYFDFMIDTPNNETEYVILKGYENELTALDSTYGLPVENYTFPEFHSSNLDHMSNRFTVEGAEFVVKDENLEHTILRNYLNATTDAQSLVYHYVNCDFASTVELIVREFPTDLYHYYSFKDSKLVNYWSRDESTANVIASVVIGPSPDVNEQSKDFIHDEGSLQNSSLIEIFNAYTKRIAFNFNRFKESIIVEKKYSIGSLILDFFTEDLSPEGIAKREKTFGFKQFLIVGKENGIVSCLNMQNGEILWSYSTKLALAQLTASSDNTILSVYSKDGVSIDLDISDLSKGPVFVSSTNRLFEGQSAKITPLFNNTLLVKLESGDLNVLNAEKSVTTDDVFVDHTAETVAAYKYLGQDEEAVLTKVWEFAPLNGKIVDVASKDPSEVVSNVGVILGNRTVLYKYLYPHLFSVASINEETQTLTVSILDAMTGAVIKSVSHNDHADFDKPVNMVFGEHWVVYSYFAHDPVPEQRLNVIELYESLTPNERITTDSTPYDVYGYISEPAILTQSFFYPEVISKMTLSKTKFGVSSKSVILELENGQITYVPKYIVNARRVEESEMSNDDKKEFMASPYYSIVPINDQMVITHQRSVLQRGNEKAQLFSAPTSLESTAYVCTLGYDLFCTRIAPSSQFDILPTSFERSQIMFTILGLIIALYVVKPWVETKKLKQTWFVKGN